MNARNRSFFYLAAIFLAGVLTGGFLGVALTQQLMMRPLALDRMAERIERQVSAKLALDRAQRDQLRPLIARSMERIAGIYAETLDKIEDVLRDAQRELEKNLRPDQIAKMGTLAPSREDFIQQHNPLPPPTPSGARKKSDRER